MSSKRGFNRREFLKVIGATTGAAAVGCTDDPVQKIIPYVVAPDEVIPGKATWYAGTCEECSSGCGMLVRVREGRVVKVEGNPAHPVNQGGLCARGQSSLQTLYDPDRVREPLRRELNGAFKSVSWKEAIENLNSLSADLSPTNPGVLLTKALSGSELSIVNEFIQRNANFKHVVFETTAHSYLEEAAEAAYGTGYRTHFDFSKADLIVNFGADFLETWVSPVEFSRQWASRRNNSGHSHPSFFIHFEPRLSLTASNADYWVTNNPGSELLIIKALIAALIAQGKSASAQIKSFAAGVEIEHVELQAGIKAGTIKSLAKRLSTAKSSLVVAGGASVQSGSESQAALGAIYLNTMLGNIDRSVLIEQGKSTTSGQDWFKSEISKAKPAIGLVVTYGINPHYTLPNAHPVRVALNKVKSIVAFAKNIDETAALANLILPLSTNFESWQDSEISNGGWNLNQPAMQPLYQTQSFGDTMLAWGSQTKAPAGASATEFFAGGATSFYEYIKAQWKQRAGLEGATFNRAIEQGGDFSKINHSGLTPELKQISFEKVESELGGLRFLAFPTLLSTDGATANRAWLQELPYPTTTAVWGSWIEMHPQLAERHGLAKGDVAQVKLGNESVEAPVYLTQHIHPNLVAMPIGQGHEAFGRFAAGIGANAFKLSKASSTSLGVELLVSGLEISKVKWKDELVTMSGSDSQHGRELIRQDVTTVDLGKDEHGAGAHGHDSHGAAHSGGHHGFEDMETRPQMYTQMEHPLYRWAMSIDLSKCTGCSACVVACYSENNIPVVGRELCRSGREMSWIRIERYLDGPEHRPVTGFMPMMCQHCGNAPCEPVCPVYATYHNEEGLNTMVYNRCVGTRYCSNNCSYKVRRFNFFKYSWPEPLTWQLNPDVTIREVGIMEKCSFCVQRIKEAENNAKDLGRHVQDGEIQPACASSCPTQAITFGNLLDRKSRVAELSASSSGYRVLDAQINTQPAVTYLKRVVVEQEI